MSGCDPGRRGRRRATVALVLALGGATVAASCADDRSNDVVAIPQTTLADAATTPDPSTTADHEGVHGSADATTTTLADAAPEGSTRISVDLGAPGRPFDRRVLGTNAPAWLGPERLADPAFRESVAALGTTVVRMPGGTWSNSYDWLACETRDAAACFWPWAARPSDFAGFLAATGLGGMWTVSINGTAQEAAALVAFFNGSAEDARVIGVDRRGRDWGTVGQWAVMRAAGGHVDPVRVDMWEVGNEVYAARPAAGPECASFGWEEVWTCDGTEYVRGDDEHDGFLAIREAMRWVDPTIAVGAVGIAGSQDGWGSFGQEVLDAAAGATDFYSVHQYSFDRGEPSVDELLAAPGRSWAGLLGGIRDGMARSGGPPPPVAVTEYNMFAIQEGDTAGLMAAPVSALHTALTIGALVDGGVDIANHWNLVNGRTEHGSDYGIFDADDGSPQPQFHGLRAWSRMLDVLVPVELTGASEGLSVHASVDGAGGVTMIVVNRSTEAVPAALEIDGLADGTELQVSTIAVDPTDPSGGILLVDGRPASGSLGGDARGAAGALEPTSASITACTFAPLSITVLSTP